MGATPPASLFEVTLGTGDVKDYYDVSLVDGYNLPLVAAPVGVHGACNATGCVSDINMGCPKELQLVGDDGGDGGVVACKSACEAFGLDQYCCGGEFAQPLASPPFIQPFSSELVQGLIAMLSTIVPAFSLARLMIMPSFSAPQSMGSRHLMGHKQLL